ncbi:MAG: hypothetical protein ACLQKH_09350 [Steroidobacteraceae bacterium]
MAHEHTTAAVRDGRADDPQRAGGRACPGGGNAAISYTVQGPDPLVPDATFKVVANGQVEKLLFPNEQVTDSAERLDSFASTRVRMVVSLR